jgi:hypothetical protein
MMRKVQGDAFDGGMSDDDGSMRWSLVTDDQSVRPAAWMIPAACTVLYCTVLYCT